MTVFETKYESPTKNAQLENDISSGMFVVNKTKPHKIKVY